MKLCRETGANFGKGGYGTSTIAVQGAIPAVLAGHVGGGVQWLDGTRIIYQTGGAGGVGPWILQSLVVASSTLATQSPVGMNFMGAGGGKWAAFLAGGPSKGVRTNIVGLGPFPDAALACVSAQGQVVLIDSQQQGQGLTVYSSAGAVLIQRPDIVLASKEVRLVDNTLAYQDQTGWHLLNVLTNSKPRWFPRTDTVGTVVPFLMGGKLHVMEVFSKVTVRQADRPQGYVVTDQPFAFSPDAMAFASGVARIGWCSNQGESVGSLVLNDVTMATGALSQGVVSGGTIVFTPQAPLEAQTFPVGPAEGDELSPERIPPVKHKVTDPKSGDLMTLPWQAWCQAVAADASATGKAVQAIPPGSQQGANFSAVQAGTEPIINAFAPQDLFTITSNDASLAFTANPATKTLDMSVVGGGGGGGAWVPVTDGDPVDPQIIFDSGGQVVVIKIPVT